MSGTCPFLQVGKILKPATDKVRIDQLLTDAGSDSEDNHRYARQCLDIEAIMPAKHGRPTTHLPDML